MSDCPPGCRVNFNIFYLREKYGQTVVTRVNRLANIRVRSLQSPQASSTIRHIIEIFQVILSNLMFR